MVLGPSQDWEPEGRQSAVSLQRRSLARNVQMRKDQRGSMVKEIIGNQIISESECPDGEKHCQNG